MTLEITKDIFDSALPVGKSCNDLVFESCHPYIEEAMEATEETLLGSVGTSAVMGDERLCALFKKYVCVKGFLAVFRQLDLVLTPTGFGVVSNDQLSPASGKRVDDLEKALWLRFYKLKGALVYHLRGVQGWGEQLQALSEVLCVYNEHEFFSHRDSAIASDWTEKQIDVNYWNGVICSKISNAMMEEILVDYRRKNFNPVIPYLTNSFDLYIDGKTDLAREVLRQAIAYMEENEENYATYINSKAYKTNHYEGFQNARDKAGFMFQG